MTSNELMLNLNDFYLFVQVVERGGFAAAGRALGVSKSTLSYRVRALEGALGARLLNRTSRRLALTDAGSAFYAEAIDMVRRAEAAESAVRSRATEPSGLVRYTSPVLESQCAMRPALNDFLRLYPKISLYEHATNRAVDLIAENFDVAIRAHPQPLQDSRLIQRVLATIDWHLFASPGYLATAEPITQPEDLQDHPALFSRRAQPQPFWQLQKNNEPGTPLIVPGTPRIISDNMAGLKDMACAGLGVTALPAYLGREEIARGTLIRVLPDWNSGRSTVSALLPETRGLLPAVRVFLDHLAATLPLAVS